MSGFRDRDQRLRVCRVIESWQPSPLFSDDGPTVSKETLMLSPRSMALVNLALDLWDDGCRTRVASLMLLGRQERALIAALLRALVRGDADAVDQWIGQAVATARQGDS